ncbi:hypothetical protein BY458DRAFT_526760 [Sporodiniella umbellata]|nr:hypothetical protein BY458DRAFT_526760 [Sporodiniella umbellata]
MTIRLPSIYEMLKGVPPGYARPEHDRRVIVKVAIPRLSKSQLDVPKVSYDTPTPKKESFHHKRSLSDPTHRYPCPTCLKTFSRPSALETHRLSHTKEKPFVCTWCRKKFSVASNMRRHLKKTHRTTINLF